MGFGDRYRTIEAERIEATLALRGWPREASADPARASTLARACLERLVARGLPADWSLGRPRFDPVEVFAFAKAAGAAGEDPFWPEHCAPSARAQMSTLLGGTEDALPGPGAPRRFRVTLQRTFGLDAIAPGARLRLRLPTPVVDDALQDLVIQPFDHPTLASTPDASEWRGPSPEAGEISIGAVFTFKATPARSAGAGDLTPSDRALYTREVEGLIRVTPAVADLARAVAGATTDDAVVARRLFDHLLDTYSCNAVHYDGTAEDVLTRIRATGRYDCQLGAALFVALCRALALPARLCSGHFLYPDAPANHYWAEVFLQGRGWAPVDLLAQDLSWGGRTVWRDQMFGRLDHRMKTEVFPQRFTGLSSVRLPSAWHMLQEPLSPGMITSFYDVQTGRLAYADAVTVEPLDEATRP